MSEVGTCEYCNTSERDLRNKIAEEVREKAIAWLDSRTDVYNVSDYDVVKFIADSIEGDIK